MYRWISRIIVSKLSKYNADLSNVELKEIAEYGIEITLSSAVNYILISLIGMCFHTIISAILFLLSFCVIRKFIGGYHCTTYFRCNMTLCLIFLLVILFSSINVYFGDIKILVMFLLWCGYGLWYIGPVQNSNKPITIKQKERCHKLAMSIYVLTVILSVLISQKSIYYSGVVVFSLTSVVILLPIGKLSERRKAV